MIEAPQKWGDFACPRSVSTERHSSMHMTWHTSTSPRETVAEVRPGTRLRTDR